MARAPLCSTLPASTMTLQPQALARRAIPTGALPIAVCPSKRPSPVTTISAARSSDSGRTASSTISTPRRSVPFRYDAKAKPSPPAAPAPGCSRRSVPSVTAVMSARCASAASSLRTVAGSAPFCGAKI